MRDTDDVTGFVETLVKWGRAWRPAHHSVEVTLGPTDREKVAASIAASGAITGGQVTAWDTGECSVEVYEVDSLVPRWVESFHLAATSELLALLDRFALVLDPSGSGDTQSRSRSDVA